jgi:hypothetical protein
MKKIVNRFLGILGVLLTSVFFLASSVALAQDFSTNPSYPDEPLFVNEYISSFVTNIKVNADNSADITEKIVYNTGESEHYGIYRYIYNTSSQDRRMSFGDVSVTDENGNPYLYTTSKSGGTFEMKIGDPNTTFSGEKTYIIKYHVTRAVAQLKNVDEIYWNVTGNEWNMPIYDVRTIVVLPIGISGTQAHCYWGEQGSTNTCEPVKNTDGSYSFSLPENLNSYEGTTVAVGFAKGLITPYTFFDDLSDLFFKYLSWLIAALLPILTAIFSLNYWYKHGRDSKGTGVIIAQYDVPDNLTPMEVSGVVNEKVNPSHLSAEIIYLATKGYLKINQLEEKYIGLIKATDYELIKLKDYSDLPNDFDQKLLSGVFESNKMSVKLSDLKYEFSAVSSSVITKVLDNLLNKKYYSNLGRVKTGPARWFVILFLAVWASGFFGIIVGILIFDNPFPIIASIFVSIITYGIVSHFYPAKTVKGVAVTEYLLGLKNYLCIAEKNRLEFHNAQKRNQKFLKSYYHTLWFLEYQIFGLRNLRGFIPHRLPGILVHLGQLSVP